VLCSSVALHNARVACTETPSQQLIREALERPPLSNPRASSAATNCPYRRLAPKLRFDRATPRPRPRTDALTGPSDRSAGHRLAKASGLRGRPSRRSCDAIPLPGYEAAGVAAGIAEIHRHRLPTRQCVVRGWQVGATLLHVEVEVWAAGLARVAAVRDALALLDAHTDGNKRTAPPEVQVARDRAVGVPNHDEVLVEVGVVSVRERLQRQGGEG